jgi:UTP--glucose-1-phosphate uridylyltransferase
MLIRVLSLRRPGPPALVTVVPMAGGAQRTLDEVDDASRAVLERFGFDQERFEGLRRQLADGSLSARSNVVRGTVEPPSELDIALAPEPGTARFEEAAAAGRAAIRRGEVAQVVLAGGMATRFGGVVKGVVEAVDGRTFLDWKLGETARLARELEARIPVAVMTSFATDTETRAHVAALDVPEPLWFSQFVAPRLTPSGGIFRDAEGNASLHGPGHGDLVEALQQSGVLETLAGRGIRVVLVSNVDNLGARVDPVVVGEHLLGGLPVTVEVAVKRGDTGGAPARVDGRLVLVEGPRFPDGFDQETIPVFNTNTVAFDLEALRGTYPLEWMVAVKDVEGVAAVQLERLFHEVTWFLDARFLEVPRTGPRGRFFPIKVPADLVTSREALREMLATSLA